MRKSSILTNEITLTAFWLAVAVGIILFWGYLLQKVENPLAENATTPTQTLCIKQHQQKETAQC